MNARLICISRTLGAGGEDIGRQVSAALGLRYVDEEIIELAAEKAGVDHSVVADAEKRRSFARRLLDELSWAGATAMTPGVALGRNEDDDAALIREVVAEVGERGEAVIVAHAASIALAGKPGLLRVLVTAPSEVRARRIAESDGLDQEAASKLIRSSDGDRAAYLNRFYGVSDESPTHYDLVLNTEVISTGDATDLVVCAAGRPVSD